MSKKKVAYVINHASFFLSHILPVVVKLKHKFEIKLFHGLHGSKKMELHAYKEIKKYRISTSNFKLSPSGLNIFLDFIALISLIRAMLNYKPDIIHCATPKGILYGGIVSRLLKIKSLVIFNTGMGFLFSNKLNLYEKIIKYIYVFTLRHFILKHRNKKIIIENNDDIKFFKKNFKIKNNEIEYIKGAGVDLYKLKSNYKKSSKLVLLPSRVIKEKGISEFAYASINLKKHFPTWRFCVAGALDYNKKSSYTKKEFYNLMKIKEVKFLGYVKNMRDLYKKSAIVCLPSYREGFSKVFQEAASMGIPIVTTNAIGCKDSIIPGKTGLLSIKKNFKSLEKNIKFLIENKNIRIKYSKNARKFATQNFDIKKVISKNIKIYKTLINNEKKTNFC